MPQPLPNLPSMPLLGPLLRVQYLQAAAMHYLSAAPASTLWNHGWQPWNPLLKPQAEQLKNALKNHNHLRFQEAVEQQALQAYQAFASGLMAFDAFAAQWQPPELPAPVWECETTCLRPYQVRTSSADSPVMLVVPSLINRAYILDMPGHSMMRHLAAAGIKTYLLDWNQPGAAEMALDVAGYVTERLEPVLAWLHAQTGRKVILVGYCMGGMMALATALHHTEKVAGLALLATPWDFHHPDVRLASFPDVAWQGLDTLFAAHDEGAECIAPEVTQSLFFWLHPGAVIEKYTRLGSHTTDAQDRELFLAREYWLHDAVPLTRGVARDCFLYWPHENRTGKNAWEVGGTPVKPETLACPAFMAIPEGDQVVPPGSSALLAGKLPDVLVQHFPSGHIGMVAGRQAPDQLWKALEKWALSL
ncbi:MAG: alpha/beta fold hydrolase [Hyphomicrobiales bacterium]|nr:alpha/beta fold hydrolase [Rickettsiales bacterium]MCP5361029.1 alpha/beta fold hydrolase [Hyphomicrobiales bacterium]